MTARVKALTVALEADIREDDIEPLIEAICLMRGVLSVTSERVSLDDYVARTRAQRNLREQLEALLNNTRGAE